jgi:flagellar hook-associated protein 2
LVDFVQAEGGKNGTLSGDVNLQLIRSGILSRMQPLFNLGILSVNKDTGHISVDSSKLDDLLENSPDTVEESIKELKSSLYDYLIYLKNPSGPIESEETALNKQKSHTEDQIEEMKRIVNSQIEIFRKQLIQVQLLQEKMQEIRAKLTATFGNVTLLPSK